MPQRQSVQRSGHSTRSIVIVIAVVAALTVVIGFQFRGSWVTLDVTQIGNRLAETEVAKESAERRLSEAVTREGVLQAQIQELQSRLTALNAVARQLEADRDQSLSEVKTLQERCQAAESQSSHLSDEVVRLKAMLPPSPSEQEKQRSADEARLAEQSRLSQVNEELRTRRMAERRLRWRDLLTRSVQSHQQVEILLAGKPSAVLTLYDGRWSQETWEGPIRALCPDCTTNDLPSQLLELKDQFSGHHQVIFHFWSLGEHRWGVVATTYRRVGEYLGVVERYYTFELKRAGELPFQEDLGTKP